MIFTRRAFLIAALLGSIIVNAMFAINSVHTLLDFGSFAASGINLAQGNNPYDSSSPLIFEIRFPVLDSGGRLPNLNPPVTLFFFGFITEENLQSALIFWKSVSFFLYIGTVFFLAYKYQSSPTKLIWTLTLAGFWHTIELGQIYIPLLLITALIWFFTDKQRPVEAGICLGFLISVKPNFIIWVLILLASKNWKLSLSTIITVVLVGLFPFALYGQEVYVHWFNVIGINSNILAMPGNSSLPGFFSRIGLSFLGTITAVILLAVISYFIYNHKSNRPVDMKAINTIGLIISLLVSPISWAGYTILLVPVFLSTPKWSKLMIISAFILSIPFPLVLHVYNSSITGAFVSGLAYTLPLVLILIEKTMPLFHQTRPVA